MTELSLVLAGRGGDRRHASALIFIIVERHPSPFLPRPVGIRQRGHFALAFGLFPALPAPRLSIALSWQNVAGSYSAAQAAPGHCRRWDSCV